MVGYKENWQMSIWAILPNLLNKPIYDRGAHLNSEGVDAKICCKITQKSPKKDNTDKHTATSSTSTKQCDLLEPQEIVNQMDKRHTHIRI